MASAISACKISEKFSYRTHNGLTLFAHTLIITSYPHAGGLFAVDKPTVDGAAGSGEVDADGYGLAGVYCPGE